jgi:hypothetical protein
MVFFTERRTASSPQSQDGMHRYREMSEVNKDLTSASYLTGFWQ